MRVWLERVYFELFKCFHTTEVSTLTPNKGSEKMFCVTYI